MAKRINHGFTNPGVVAASEVCESIFDGTHDSPKRKESGFRLVTSRHIKSNRILTDEAYFISEEDYLKIVKRSGLEVDDVLFTMIGTVGEICRVKSNPDFAIKNIGVFRPKVKSDGLWLYYFLVSPEGKKRIEALKRGTTQQFMGLKELRDFPIDFPGDAKYRKSQVKVLELLDSKIAKCMDITRTLEEIAQEVFKSWFINFDPVKAKMVGEKPFGMDDAMAALFPDSMEDSRLGPIPKGWKVGTMAELFGLQGGYSFKASSWQEVGVPVVKIGSVKPGLVDLEQVSYIDDSLAQATSGIYRLPRGSLVIGLTGYVGEVGLVRKHREIPLLNQRVAKFLPVNGDWKIPFVYCLTRRPQFKQRVIEAANGSAQQNVSNSQILSLETCVPSIELIKTFDSCFELLFEQILLLAEHGLMLSELRDSLLPRLISGELQIPEEVMVS